MFKKLIFIGLIFVLITPIPSAFETGQIVNDPIPQTIDPDIITMLTDVNESILRYYLEKFLSFGTKFVGSDNCKKTADWIKQEFENLGLYTYFDNWKFPQYKDRNVVSLINGTDQNNDAVIVICAHYDTTKVSPGANDDGSGIAAMLTIANITSKFSFNHTIRFVAVSGEEIGCYGSFADAKKAYKENENILITFNLDMLGYTKNQEDEKYVIVGAPERSKRFIDTSKEILQQYSQEINLEIVPLLLNYPCDHDPYNDYGYDAIWFSHLTPDEYHQDHTPNDTIDKINFMYLTNFTKLILAVTTTLATKPINVQVRIIKPFEGHLYLKNIPILKLPCFNIWTTKIRAVTYIIGKATVKINITSTETIKDVYYALDGFIKHNTSIPPYEYTIGKGSLDFYFKLHRGYHRLTVWVITDYGKTAMDEMDIFLLKLL